MASGGTRRGLLLILSSPSGAGKSTLARRLVDWDPTIRFSVSVTTRPQRSGEMDGREYHFRSKEVFEEMVAANQLLEHATVFGNLYGSPYAPVVEALANGTDVLFDIDWQGGQQIRSGSHWQGSGLSRDAVSIFLLPPSMAELERRLQARAQDTAEVIAARMAKSRDEISHWAEYDYVLVNRSLDATFADLTAIVTAERLRRDRQPDLSDHVRRLNAEAAAE